VVDHGGRALDLHQRPDDLARLRSPEMSKFCSERCVCAPHSLSAGTSIGPKVSRSARVLGEVVMVKKLRSLGWLRPLAGCGAEYPFDKNGSHLKRLLLRAIASRYALSPLNQASIHGWGVGTNVKDREGSMRRKVLLDGCPVYRA
jgi:hypothetical protein